MPLRNDGDFGTNRDGSKSEDYCFHCFQGGKFLDEGRTLQEKIEKNVKFGVQMGMPKRFGTADVRNHPAPSETMAERVK